MRLSDVLSRPPTSSFTQVEGFLVGKTCKTGQQIKLDIGQVALNFFCIDCDDFRTFYSCGALTCVCINKTMISIDSVLTCGNNPSVQVWFLVESDGDISAQAPKVKIIKRTEKLPDSIRRNRYDYGSCSALLEKSRQAYQIGLGAGSLVYLRKAFEVATIQAAEALDVEYPKHKDGNPRNFADLLRRVDEKSSIIPQEFSSDGYKLYRELSGVVHGAFNESDGLIKFEPLYRLVVGVLDNIKNKQDFESAKAALGWCDDGGVLI